MKMKGIAFGVVVVLSLGLALPVRCAAPSVAELLPPESLGYVEVSNMEVIYYLIGEIGNAAVKSLEEEPEFPEDIKVKASAAVEAFGEIKALLPKSVALGVVGIDPQKGHPSLLFVSEQSEGLAPVLSALGKLLPAVPELNVVKTDYGVEVAIPHAPIGPIGYTVKDKVLYATMGEGLLGRVLSNAPSERLSQTPRFRSTNAVTGKNAFLSAYVNADAVWNILLPNLPAKPRFVADLLGVKEIHSLGISLVADEKVCGCNLALEFTENAPGIAGLLSVANSKPKGIAYVPEDFSYFSRCSLGPPAELMKKVRELLAKAGVGGNIDQAFANVKEGLGVDVDKVLAALGGEMTFGLKIPETIGIPNMLLCLEAKDPGYLLETVKGLLTRVQMPFTEMEVSGRKALMITPNIPVPVSPVIAADSDALIIGVSMSAIQKALAAKESGRNIGSKESFKAAMQGLPAESNVSLRYAELENLGQLAVSGLLMASAGAPPEARPVISRGMQYVSKAFQNLEPGVEVAYRTPNGLAVQSRMGTRSFMQLVTNGSALAAKAAMVFIIHKPEVVTQEATEPAATPAEQ